MLYEICNKYEVNKFYLVIVHYIIAEKVPVINKIDYFLINV